MDNFDINNVFISYIDLMDPTKRRQEYLLKHYYFGCQVWDFVFDLFPKYVVWNEDPNSSTYI